MPPVVVVAFQFLIGRLVTLRAEQGREAGAGGFQFLIGRLVTRDQPPASYNVSGFQFLIGRLVTQITGYVTAGA
mgnify:CR=1 FL=1